MRIGLGLGITHLRNGAFTPSALPGLSAWYDPSDLSTLFQDAEGTTPVTAAGQSLGMVRDKSGNARHATQATAAARPTWQTGLASFDGVDDFLVTPTVTWGSDEVTLVVGLRKLSDAALGIVCDLGANPSSGNGSFGLLVPQTTTYGVGWQSRGTSLAGALSANPRAPATFVATATGKIASDTATIRVNGAQVASSAADQGTGNYTDAALYLGMRAGTGGPFNGHIYGMALYNRVLSAGELAQAEAWMAAKAGVEL